MLTIDSASRFTQVLLCVWLTLVSQTAANATDTADSGAIPERLYQTAELALSKARKGDLKESAVEILGRIGKQYETVLLPADQATVEIRLIFLVDTRLLGDH